MPRSEPCVATDPSSLQRLIAKYTYGNPSVALSVHVIEHFIDPDEDRLKVVRLLILIFADDQNTISIACGAVWP